MTVVIKVENVSKKYRLGTIGTKTLKGDLQRWWSRVRGKEDPFAKVDHATQMSGGDFWALQDISFEIRRGEAVGIIGKNGAGKSTLLKILSRITTPTTGGVKIKGRIASLLEVGTGFNPELTGRENIFLNGAILGMRKREVEAKFEEIVDFSGIEKFIDTPVKRYSSGMYVRLAFAVAAHLESEILILDEVLAVGDSVFQQKCIDKMTQVTQTGKTILFVSHSFSAVRRLCTSAMLLERGKCAMRGSVEDVILKYTNADNGIKTGEFIMLSNVERNGFAHQLIFDSVCFKNYPLHFDSDISFRLKLRTQENGDFSDLDFGIAITDRNDNIIIHCSNRFLNLKINHHDDKTEYHFSIKNNLKPGIYRLTLFLRCKDIIQDWLTEIVSFEVLDGNPYNFTDTKQIQGMILPNFNIEILQVNEKHFTKTF
jgi:lipopolysaccharide transport system ATP-binding protein